MKFLTEVFEPYRRMTGSGDVTSPNETSAEDLATVVLIRVSEGCWSARKYLCGSRIRNMAPLKALFE
jgi:hypothetical protein